MLACVSTQVDSDLRAFKKDAQALLAKLQGTTAWKADPVMAQEQTALIER